MLVLRVGLGYSSGPGHVDTPDQADVNSVTGHSPTVVSAKCQTGKWWLRILGEETGVGGTIPIPATSIAETNIVC